MTSQLVAQLAILVTSISTLTGGIVAWRKSRQDHQTQATIDAIKSWKELAETFKEHFEEAEEKNQILQQRLDSQAKQIYILRQEIAVLELKLLGKLPLDKYESGDTNDEFHP